MAFPVSFNGGKYDLKQFLKDHPGGANTLKMFKGQSVLTAMEKYHHSTSAYHILNDFKIESGLKDSNLTGKLSDSGRIITNEESSMDVSEIAFLEELENKLDWSKPMIQQLHIIAPDYEKWVNSSVYRRCRLFESPLLETLSYTPWYLVPAFWIPIILYLGYGQFMEHVYCGDACTNTSLTSIEFLFHIVVGVLVWTVLEYFLHRFVFHHAPGENLTMIKIHFMFHGIHHKTPFDGLRQVFPPIPAFAIACVLYGLVQFIFTYPKIKIVGGLIGYLSYDMIHYYEHHGSPKDGTYLYAMKRYHSNHHFVNHDKAFGVTSKLWDYVFKTVAHVKRLGFSLQW